MNKLILAICIMALTGCANKLEYKQVKCYGTMIIGPINKKESILLKKYDEKYDRYYSNGKGNLGMQGWHYASAFDQITCIN